MQHTAARRLPAAETQRVFCRAPHPDTYKATGGVACANLLGDIPAGYTFVATTATRPPMRADGRLWLQCSRSACKIWNVFERGAHKEG